MNQQYTDIIKCLNYTSISFNIAYLLTTLFVIYNVSNKKDLGIVVCFILLLVICFVPYTIEYLPLTMIKLLMLIIFPSLLLFFSFKFTCIQDTINQILTICVRLNIFCLILIL